LTTPDDQDYRKDRHAVPAARRLKVVYVCHNHPAIRPGGAEQYAFELYEAMRDSDAVEPVLVARTGPPLSSGGPAHPGTPFARLNDDPHQLLLYTDGRWDDFLGKFDDKLALTLHFREFLQAFQPDVVHVQHTASIGYELLRVTRQAVPQAAIVYTLHDFRPLCHHHGLLLKTAQQGLCWGPSPAACHACFPTTAPTEFFLRNRYIRAHFALVDHFLAPSEFLRQRYIDWGLSSDRIQYLDYGRQVVRRSIATTDATRDRRTRFGFFGQVNPVKGVDVLLRAMQQLGKSAPTGAHLWMNGANLDLQGDGFRQQIETLRTATRQTVTWLGPYGADQVADRMALVDWVIVPSIWWENSPLVIQEAFAHGRPVICSDIGGMAEKVADGVNGLHFRVGDATDLARTLQRAATQRGLWEQVQAGIPAVPAIDDSVALLLRLYHELTERRRRRPLATVLPAQPA
jgi:glycosyltransferase involved in cell wall biosynthesis